MIHKLFVWLSVMLGIESLRQELHGVHARINATLYEMQRTIEAAQKAKTEHGIVATLNKTPKQIVYDFESSQRATLEEFKEQ